MNINEGSGRKVSKNTYQARTLFWAESKSKEKYKVRGIALKGSETWTLWKEGEWRSEGKYKVANGKMVRKVCKEMTKLDTIIKITFWAESAYYTTPSKEKKKKKNASNW